MANRSILIVDDNEINRAILGEVFRNQYDVIEAENGRKAIEAVANIGATNIACILLDIMMPEMDGYETLEKLKEMDNIQKKVPVIMITADASAEAEKTSYEKGALDVLHKPFDPVIIKQRVSRSVEFFDSRNNLEAQVNDQTKILKKQFLVLKKQEEKLRENNLRIIDTICTIVEFRNLESGYHLTRVKGFVKILANQLMNTYPEYKLTPHKIDVIVSASAMHDIGKIAIPDAILLKPGRLTADEFEVMKSHTTRGCEIIEMLSDITDKEYYDVSLDICRHHHEKYDGKGYPDGLKGEQISVAAQLTALADVYDALVSDRVYKAAFPMEKAFEMIINGECGVFSPKIMNCFEICKPALEALVLQTKEKEQADDFE